MTERPVQDSPTRFTPIRALVWLAVAAASILLSVLGIIGMIVKG